MVKKSSSDNCRILKSSNSSHNIEPFLLRSVGISEDISPYPIKEEKESLKVKLAREAH